MLCDAGAQRGPVVARAREVDAPHVGLDDALAHGAALVRGVRARHLRELAARAQRGKVDRLEDIPAAAAAL